MTFAPSVVLLKLSYIFCGSAQHLVMSRVRVTTISESGISNCLIVGRFGSTWLTTLQIIIENYVQLFVKTFGIAETCLFLKIDLTPQGSFISKHKAKFSTTKLHNRVALIHLHMQIELRNGSHLLTMFLKLIGTLV